MKTEKFLEDQNNFSISHDLVLLLEWLLTHKREQLKALIKKSVTQGLSEYIHQETEKELDQAILYYTIVDFFETVESMLQEVIDEEITKRASQNKFLKTINNFDNSVDKTTIQASLEKVVKQMTKEPDQGTTDKLLKEVLLRWKPIKQQSGIN